MKTFQVNYYFSITKEVQAGSKEDADEIASTGVDSSLWTHKELNFDESTIYEVEERLI